MVGLGAVILIALAVTQETYRRYQIQKEIDDLKTQAEKKEKNNQKLEGLIGYLKTDDFQEKEAKEKLSLQKEGEKVMIIKEDNQSNNVNTNDNSSFEAPSQPQQDQRSNQKRWWDYFFAD